MDQRVKYTIRKKLSAVRLVESGKFSSLLISRKLGCSKSMIEDWLKLYRLHGSKGLKLRNGSYDAKFKIRVIRHMKRNGLSLSRTAAFFGIPQRSAVSRWLRIYESLGFAGLRAENRGRKKRQMAPKSKKKEKIDRSDTNAAKIAALQKEVEYLRAENAFLKKLDALIQREEAGKRQKPSRN